MPEFFDTFFDNKFRVDPSYRGKIIQNLDGSSSSERTIGIELDGKYYNIPSLVDGIQLSNDEAVRRFKAGEIKAVGVADSQEEATRIAGERSKMLGQEKRVSTNFMDNLFSEEPRVPKEARLPEGASPITVRGDEPGMLFTGKEPTGEISAITGKPQMRDIPTSVEDASFGAMFKVGFVDTPLTKMKVYSKARGLPLENYDIMDDGSIIFLADDGMWHKENPTSIKKFAAQMGANAPALILGTGMAVTGHPWLAIPAAAGGEGIRKTIGATIFDEPQTTTGNIIDMLITGGAEAGGIIAGRWTGKSAKAGINVALRRRAGERAAIISKEIQPMVLKKRHREAMKELVALGKKHDIDLPPPIATDNPILIQKYNDLINVGQTHAKLRASKEYLNEQVDSASMKMLDSIGTKEEKSITGGNIKEAANTYLNKLFSTRQAKAGPLYKKAYKESGPVDVEPVIDYIDAELKTAKGPIRAALLKSRKTFLVPDLPKKETIPLLYGPKGEVVSGGVELTWETSLKGLHGSKVGIDGYIGSIKDKAIRSSADNLVLREYGKVKKLLLKQMDIASPSYKKARAIFSTESVQIAKEHGKKALVTKLSRLEPSEFEKARQMIFKSDPLLIKKTGRMISRHNSELWDKAVRGHIDDIFAKSRPLGDIPNVAGAIHNTIFKDPNQLKILEAAMTKEQFKDFTGLMRVFGVVGKGFKKPGKIVTYKRENFISALIRAKTRPLYTYTRIPADVVRGKLKEQGLIRLADAFIDPSLNKQLVKVMQLSEKSDAFWGALGGLVGQVVTAYDYVPKTDIEEVDTLEEPEEFEKKGSAGLSAQNADIIKRFEDGEFDEKQLEAFNELRRRGKL